VTLRERSPVDEFVHSLRDGVAAALRRLANLLSPPPPDAVETLLASAPVDDEPVTPDDAAAIDNARREHERGETVSLAEIKRTGV
jgi:hypothetical protein